MGPQSAAVATQPPVATHQQHNSQMNNLLRFHFLSLAGWLARLLFSDHPSN